MISVAFLQRMRSRPDMSSLQSVTPHERNDIGADRDCGTMEPLHNLSVTTEHIECALTLEKDGVKSIHGKQRN